MVLYFVVLCVSFVLAHRSASAHRCEPLCNNHLRVSHRETQRSHKETLAQSFFLTWQAKTFEIITVLEDDTKLFL
jgi:hypothetical protein